MPSHRARRLAGIRSLTLAALAYAATLAFASPATGDSVFASTSMSEVGRHKLPPRVRAGLPARAEGARLAPDGAHGAYRLDGNLHLFDASTGRDLFEPWTDATGLVWSRVSGRIALVERFQRRSKGAPRLDVVEPGLLRVVQLELDHGSARSVREFGRDLFLVRTQDSLEVCETSGAWVRTVKPEHPLPADQR